MKVCVAAGLHEVQAALLLSVGFIMGSVTPPVGVCYFTAAAIAGEKIEKVARAIMPFLLVEIAVMFLILTIPALTLTVPTIVGPGQMNTIAVNAKQAPRWFRVVDRIVRSTITWFTCSLLVLMVAFTIYTVVMRYVFHDPPFWGDTIALFCNIWLVLLAYALAVRDREDIASEGIYEFLTPKTVLVLRFAWRAMTFIFGVLLFWFGLDAALNVPGQYWELGGLPKRAPMMVLPICGVLIALVTAFTLAEDLFGWRAVEDRSTLTLQYGATTVHCKGVSAIGTDNGRTLMARNRWSFVGAAVLAAAVALAPAVALAQAKPVKIRIQSVIPTSADEVTMLKEFTADVAALTGNSVTFEILPAGAVVAVNDTLDAVDKGLIEGGFAWTHYWSGKHPAAGCSARRSPARASGIDNFAWVVLVSLRRRQAALRPAVDRDEGQRQGLHPAARRPGGARLVQDADQQHGRLPQDALPHAARHPGRELQGDGCGGGRHGRRRHPAGAREGRARRGRMVLPEARHDLRLPQGAEALLHAGTAPGGGQRRHVHQQEGLGRLSPLRRRRSRFLPTPR